MWSRNLLRNNRWSSPILQRAVQTQRKIRGTWEEFIHKPGKEGNWIWVGHAHYFYTACFEPKTMKSKISEPRSHHHLFSVLSYANVTIGKQFSHSADFYDAPKLNYKVKWCFNFFQLSSFSWLREFACGHVLF